MARRTRLTRPYPVHTLEDVLSIPETIQEGNGGLPVPTDLLAETLGTTRRSSAFVQKLGSSARYGLTVGSHSSDQIALTELGESMTAPRDPEERSKAIRDAALEPAIFRRFYDIYSGKPLPEMPYASNILVRELGVHQELTEECLRIIRLNGLFAEIVKDRTGHLIVDGPMTTEADREPVDSLSDPVHENSVDSGHLPAEAPFVLVLALHSDPLAEEVVELVKTLSIPARTVEIDANVPETISPEISSSLRSARGCIVVWPKSVQTEVGRQLQVRTWMTLGAASFQLGKRVVIVGDVNDDVELAEVSGSLDLTVIDPGTDSGIFPSLMSALVSRSIVQVSFG